jgi:uncharacterized integral membrane protein
MTDPNQPGYPPPNHPDPGRAAGPGSQPMPGGPAGSGSAAQPGGPPPNAAGTQQGQQAGASKPARAVSVGQILGAILFILLIIFIVENSHNVGIRIIAGPVVHPPVYVAILIAAVLGALISWLLRYRRRVGARRKQMVREHKAEGSQQG